jgi:glycolate oxidase iron-sulfur subunit
LRIGQRVRPLLPASLQRKVPPRVHATAWPGPRNARRMLVLQGCVQPGIAPSINPAMARVLDAIGISLIAADEAGCCGAVAYHLNAQDEGLQYMRRNIDAWWPHVEQGIEAIVMTASGCGVLVKEYGHLLAGDPQYAQKAAKISALTKDAAEILISESPALERALNEAHTAGRAPRIAFHAPCTLQHGQKISGVAERLLKAAGCELTFVPDGHLCCGSAGTYSLLQSELSQRLLANKVGALESGGPEAIATANIGCLAHMQTGTQLPVRHWVEVLEEQLSARHA